MKKLHSTIMMLAMMVAALSFSACNGDEEDGVWGADMNGNSVSGYMATITFDDCNVHEIVSPYMAMHTYSKSCKYFCIMPTMAKFIYIYVSEMPHLNADLNEYITEFELMELSFTEMGDWEHEAGSAKVIMNDGEYITISFTNYQISYTVHGIFGNEKEHKLTINGKIKFLIEPH